MNLSTIKCTSITADAELRESLSAQVAQIPGAEMVRGLRTYPPPENVARFFQASPARIVFLDVRNAAAALKISGEMELSDPGIQFIAVGEPGEAEASWRGIQERLSLPLDFEALSAAIGRRAHVLSRLPRRYQRPTSFISFVPAKAGAGASTLAACLGNIVSSAHKTLLFDFDLGSGTVGFRHRSERSHAVAEVLENVDHLDEQLWSQMLSYADKLHLIASKATRRAQVDETALNELFDFLRTMYDVVIFDLSGDLEDYSLQVMRACSRVFLVTTQEVDCLHLGRAKAEDLRLAGLDDRLGVLLNRAQKSHLLGRTAVEDLMGLPVKAEFPNDYRSVQASVENGIPISQSSALSKALRRSVPILLEERHLEPKPRRFIEFLKLPVFEYWGRGEVAK